MIMLPGGFDREARIEKSLEKISKMAGYVKAMNVDVIDEQSEMKVYIDLDIYDDVMKEVSLLPRGLLIMKAFSTV